MGAPDDQDLQLDETEVDEVNGATRERGAGAGNSLRDKDSIEQIVLPYYFVNWKLRAVIYITSVV